MEISAMIEWRRPSLLVLLVVGLGCARDGVPESASAPETPLEITASGPDDSGTAERNERLLRLEQALDNWWKQNQEQQYSVQDGIENHLASYVNKYYEPICDDLASGSPRHRRAAAAALGFARRADSIPFLLEGLRDPYREVVLHSLLSLYHLARKGIAVPLDPVVPYLRHPHDDIRSNAALVLAHAAEKTDDPALLLPLIAALEDQSPSVRVHAAAALGAMSQEDAVPHLVKLLSDPVQLVRLRALIALGRIGSREPLPWVAPLLTDEKPEVRRTAHRILVQLTGEDFGYDARRWSEFFRSAPPR